MDFNPYLASTADSAAGDPNKGGSEAIEHPERTPNIPWQTRPAVLSGFETNLADTLMAIFREGVEALPDVVAKLNAGGPKHPDGSWTEANYQSLMQRLAQGRSA